MEYRHKKLDKSCAKEFKEIAKRHLAIPSLWIENYSFDENEVNEVVEELKNKHKSDNIICYIIEDEGKLLAFIWAEIKETNIEDLYITSLWVDENYRKQGMAIYLKKVLEDWAKKQSKIKRITTTVSIRNESMLKLNKKLGYSISSYNMIKKIDNND